MLSSNGMPNVILNSSLEAHANGLSVFVNYLEICCQTAFLCISHGQ